MDKIKETIFAWMKNDSFERIAIISIGVLIVFLVSKLIKSRLNNKVANTQNKYKARKAVNFFGYLFIVAIVIFTYSDKLGNVGTAIGVAGAGIAFALQEVIVSFAGWLNIIISNQVAVGNRVKIGEVKGDIIDMASLLQPLWKLEIGLKETCTMVGLLPCPTILFSKKKYTTTLPNTPSYGTKLQFQSERKVITIWQERCFQMCLLKFAGNMPTKVQQAGKV